MSEVTFTLGPDAATNERRFEFYSRHAINEAKRHADMFGIPSTVAGPFPVADWGPDGVVERWTLTLTGGPS